MTAAEDRLAEIEGRAAAATEGPWREFTTGPRGGDHWHVCDSNESVALIHASDGEDEDQREPDAAFIAHARTDVPLMAAALRAVLAGRPNHASGCGCGSCSQYKRTVTAITAALTPAEVEL